jgi:hypothetical protein
LSGGGTESITGVAGFGGGFVAAGLSYRSDDTEPIVVVSPDGAALAAEHPGAGTGEQWPSGICVAPDGAVVVVGAVLTGDDADVYAWRRDPAGGWAQARAPDGSFSGPRFQAMRDCRATANGYVAVGFDGRDVAVGNNAAIWSSPDGLAWTQMADPDDSLGGENDQFATALVELPTGSVLVTIEDATIDDADIRLVQLDPDGTLRRIDAGEVELRGAGRQSASGIAVVGSTVVIVGDNLGGAGVWEAPLESLST